MMKALDQIISSGGQRRTGMPSMEPGTACVNQRSSTTATPFPALKIRSMKRSPAYALASQWGNVSSVANPASPRAASADSQSSRRRNTSRSFVSRTMPVNGASAWAPPIRNSTRA